MFDQFGAVDVGHENRRHEWFVDLLHEVDSVFALRANHNPVRMHQVGHRAAFTQKFGIADHVKLGPVPVIALDGLADFFARFNWDRALVHDHTITRSDARYLAGHFFDKAEVDA